MRTIDVLRALADGGYMRHKDECAIRQNMRGPCTCGFEELIRTAQVKTAERELSLTQALEPFAALAERLGAGAGIADDLFIKVALRVNDCVRAHKALKDLE